MFPRKTTSDNQRNRFLGSFNFFCDNFLRGHRETDRFLGVTFLFVQIKITGDMASYHKVIGGGNFAVAVAIRGKFG